MFGMILMTISAAWVGSGDAPEGVAEALAPTMVRLRAGEYSPVDIARTLGSGGGNLVEFSQPPVSRGFFGAEGATRQAQPLPRTIAIRGGEKTFWAAIDEICHESGLRPVAGAGGQSRVVLVPASRDPGFVSNEGAFRVAISRLSYNRGWPIPPDRARRGSGLEVGQRRSAAGLLRVELDVMIEPRLRIVKVDGVSVSTAADERGRSLLIGAAGSDHTDPSDHVMGASGCTVALGLLYPDEPGRTIETLRGEVALVAEGGKPAKPRRVKVGFSFKNIPMP